MIIKTSIWLKKVKKGTEEVIKRNVILNNSLKYQV